MKIENSLIKRMQSPIQFGNEDTPKNPRLAKSSFYRPKTIAVNFESNVIEANK